MFELLDRPRLRPGLAAAHDEGNPNAIILWDRLRLSQQALRLPPREFSWLQMLDGRRTLREIQAEAMRQTGGELLPIERFTSLVEQLDAALFLDTPRFYEYLNAPVREPSCIGCYPADPDALRRLLNGLFTHPKGPGRPGP